MTFTDSKERFSSRVESYVKYRPGYPAALLDLLRDECGLRAEASCVLADVGSGTGFLAEIFLKQGNRVFGVEPNTEMREAGEEYLRNFARFVSVPGCAEATTLGDSSVNFVTAGQAFHWFEPAAARREFSRILTPGGWVALVWNHRRMDTPFAQDYEALLKHYGTDYEKVRASYPEAHTVRHFFDDAPCIGRDLHYAQTFDWDGLAGRLHSSSYAPHPGHEAYEPMMAELRQLFAAHAENGRLRMEYETKVYFGQLNGGRKQA